MTTYYLDSSAIVKRYLVEPGTAWVRTVTDPASGDVTVISEITLVEVAAAFASRYRGDTITIAERDTGLRLFLHHADHEVLGGSAGHVLPDAGLSQQRQNVAQHGASGMVRHGRHLSCTIDCLGRDARGAIAAALLATNFDDTAVSQRMRALL